MSRLVDLSHAITDGMNTYKGLPGPHICDFWTREDSAGFYDDGSSFQIGRIDMIANTGTYLDTPFHPTRTAPTWPEHVSTRWRLCPASSFASRGNGA